MPGKRERRCPPMVFASESPHDRAYGQRDASARRASKLSGVPPGFLQVAPSRGLFQTRRISFAGEQKHKMADPIARRPRIIRRSPGGVALKFVSRLIRPTIVTGMMAALIATADTPTVVPLACRVTITRTGGVWIYIPDCSDQSPRSQPSPNRPPSGPGTPPGAPSTP